MNVAPYGLNEFFEFLAFLLTCVGRAARHSWSSSSFLPAPFLAEFEGLRLTIPFRLFFVCFPGAHPVWGVVRSYRVSVIPLRV